MAKGIVSPHLAAFLQGRVSSDPDLKPRRLAEMWAQRTGVQEAPSEEAIRHWLLCPAEMSQSQAISMLRVSNLEDEWNVAKSSSRLRSRISGLFDLRTQRHGLIKEMDINRLQAEGLDAVDVSEQLVNMDMSLFADFGNSELAFGTASDWYDLMVAHPDTWRVFVGPTGEVLGYWMFVNPTPDIFYRGVAGEYPEHAITVDTVRSIWDGDVHVYGPGMYSRVDFTKQERTRVGSHLIMSCLYQIDRLQSLGVKFSKICIPVCSEQGRILAEKRLGLEGMPRGIASTYAKNMGWPLVERQGRLLPQIYFGDIDEALKGRAGLILEEIEGAELEVLA